MRQSLIKKNTNHSKSMNQFHHCGNPLRKTQILPNQWLNSTTAANPYSEKYKSSNINNSIPPRQQSLKKNTNHPKSVSPFNHCGNPLLRKIQIIQHQWLHSTTAAIPYSEKYKSSTINESIPPLRQSPFQKKQILHHQWVHSITAAIPY